MTTATATGTIAPTVPIMTSAKNGELWVQPDGPNTEPVLLGCFEMGDLQEPDGEVVKSQAIVGGSYVSRGTTRRPPGNVTFSLDDFLPQTLSYIESLRCPATFYVVLRACGRAGIFTNYVRALALTNVYRSGKRYVGMVKQKEDAEMHVAGEFVADTPILKFVRPTAARQSTSETGDLNSVSFCSEDSCNVPGCSTATEKGQTGYVAGSVPYVGSTANLVETLTSGATWAASAADPFIAGQDIAFVRCFALTASTTRIIVGLKTAVGGSPASIKYSDDGGDTWTAVSVGSVNGQYFVGGQSVFVYDLHHIWVVTTGGYIYFSDDGAVTWTEQEEGVITTDPLNAIHMLDDLNGIAGGDGNILAITSNGVNWSAISGPAAEAANDVKSVAMLDEFRFWVTYSSGNIYFTRDGGTTWTARSTWSGAGTGSIPCTRWYNELSGWFIHNTAGGLGYVFHTINGGYDWEAVNYVTNTGLNDIAVIDENTAYVVGDATGGTAVILKVAA